MHARARTRDHDRRPAPARRLSGSGLCAALSRPARADPRRRRKADAGGRLLAETARHLALRMSYEDVIRVAQAKIDPARYRAYRARDGRQARADLSRSPSFSSPASRSSVRFCRRGLRGTHPELAERYPALGRLHWGMAIKTASVFGYLRFHAREAAGFRPRDIPLSAKSSAPSKRGCALSRRPRRVGRACPRNRGMRPPDQRLWRYPQARHGNYRLIVDRSDRSGAGRRHAAAPARPTRSPAPAPRRLLDPDGEALAKCFADIAAPVVPSGSPPSSGNKARCFIVGIDTACGGRPGVEPRPNFATRKSPRANCAPCIVAAVTAAPARFAPLVRPGHPRQ